MNYKLINKSIIDSKNEGVIKDFNNHEIYKYLMQNTVAYYYAKHVNKIRNTHDQMIINFGNKKKAEYLKTLKLLDVECKKNKIRYLIFKTFRYFDEPVYNDIDIIVKKADFHKLLGLLSKKGFECEEDEVLKGRCLKKGYLKIEPRVNISFHNKIIIAENQIWNNTEKVKLNNMNIEKTSREVDVVSQILNIMYGPNYYKLYLHKMVKETNLSKIKLLIKDNAINKDMDVLLKELVSEKNLVKKFPLFLKNQTYLNFWFKRILKDKNVLIMEKLKHIVFFFYMKYKYVIFNSLHFEYDKAKA